MEIVAINGSPSGGRGNTAALLEYVLEGARRAGATTDVVQLATTRVLPCRACHLCHVKGRCPHTDEFEVVRREIVEADGLVLASPVFVGNVSAQLKAFIDRCSLVIHTMGFRGRYGAVVVTSGGGEDAWVTDYLRHFLMMTGVMPVGAITAVTGGRGPGDVPAAARRRATELGKNLVRAWQEEASDPEAEAFLEAFEQRMRDLVAAHADEWPFDHQYWQRKQQGNDW